jgi:hypothetical protein
MSRHSLLLGIAVMLYGQNAFAENRLTDPIKVARSGLEDLKSIGKADPAQVIIAYNVECLPK